MFVAVKLVGVYYVVPDAVEAAYYRSDGGEEGVSHPDGEYGVLLSECLTGGYGVVVSVADLSAEPELKSATKERDDDEPKLGRELEVSMHDAASGDGDSQGKSDSPEIERDVRSLGKFFGKRGGNEPQQESRNQREEQEREHLAEDQ